MTQKMILYPAMAMMLLNLAVALTLFVRRVKAVGQGLNPAYFRFNRGLKLPEPLLTAEQHYQNVYEMPLLFFVLVLVAYLAVGVGPVLLGLAWAYVFFRIAHTLIHLGNNNLLWRRNAFVGSYLVLSGMWLVVLVTMFER